MKKKKKMTVSHAVQAGKIKPEKVEIIKAEIIIFMDGHFSLNIKARDGVNPDLVEVLRMKLDEAVSKPQPQKKARPIAVTKTNQVEPMPVVRALRKPTA